MVIIVTFRHHLEREMERLCVCVYVWKTGGTGTDGQQTARGGREGDRTDEAT